MRSSLTFWQPGASAPGLQATSDDNAWAQTAFSEAARTLGPESRARSSRARDYRDVSDSSSSEREGAERRRREAHRISPAPVGAGANGGARDFTRRLLYAVEHHRVTLVSASTVGAGPAATEVPQALWTAGWADGGRQVLVTQPTRAQAKDAAARVARERDSTLGISVDYSAGGVDSGRRHSSADLRVLFLTDAGLLRELLGDPLLLRASVVVVGEAHLRSAVGDVVAGLLKRMLRRRLDVRLVFLLDSAAAPAAVGPLRAFFADVPPVAASEAGKGGTAASPSLAPCCVLAGGSVDGPLPPTSQSPQEPSMQRPVRVAYAKRPVADIADAAVRAALAAIDGDVALASALAWTDGESEAPARLGTGGGAVLVFVADAAMAAEVENGLAEELEQRRERQDRVAAARGTRGGGYGGVVGSSGTAGMPISLDSDDDDDDDDGDDAFGPAPPPASSLAASSSSAAAAASASVSSSTAPAASDRLFSVEVLGARGQHTGPAESAASAIGALRRVIVATDAAAARWDRPPPISLVIDSGAQTLPVYDTCARLTKMTRLPVSVERANTRAGYAGRGPPVAAGGGAAIGACLRLYPERLVAGALAGEEEQGGGDDASEEATAAGMRAVAGARAGVAAGRAATTASRRGDPQRALALPLRDPPEVQRTELSSLLLQLKSLGVGNLQQFDWLSAPSPRQLAHGLARLVSLGAIDEDGEITKGLGAAMAELALDPALARVVLEGVAQDCPGSALTLVSAVAIENLFTDRGGDVDGAGGGLDAGRGVGKGAGAGAGAAGDRHAATNRARMKFAVVEGDHLTLLSVMRSFAVERLRVKAALAADRLRGGGGRGGGGGGGVKRGREDFDHAEASARSDLFSLEGDTFDVDAALAMVHASARRLANERKRRQALGDVADDEVDVDADHVRARRGGDVAAPRGGRAQSAAMTEADRLGFWCRRHRLSFPALLKVEGLRRQLRTQLARVERDAGRPLRELLLAAGVRAGAAAGAGHASSAPVSAAWDRFDVDECPKRELPRRILHCLFAGLFANAARAVGRRAGSPGLQAFRPLSSSSSSDSTAAGGEDGCVYLHPSSVVTALSPALVVYSSVVDVAGRAYMRLVSVVPAGDDLVAAAPAYFRAGDAAAAGAAGGGGEAGSAYLREVRLRASTHAAAAASVSTSTSTAPGSLTPQGGLIRRDIF